MKNEKVKDILENQYGKQLHHAFTYYVKLSDLDSSPQKTKMMASKVMQFQCLLKLLKDFKIVPALVSPEDIKVLYKHLIRHKESDETEKLRALSYEDFLEAIVRTAVLAKDKLAEIQLPKLDSVDRRLKLPINFSDISGVNPELLERLFLYMKIPAEYHKVKFDYYLNDVRENSHHVLPSKQLKDLAKSKN